MMPAAGSVTAIVPSEMIGGSSRAGLLLRWSSSRCSGRREGRARIMGPASFDARTTTKVPSAFLNAVGLTAPSLDRASIRVAPDADVAEIVSQPAASLRNADHGRLRVGEIPDVIITGVVGRPRRRFSSRWLYCCQADTCPTVRSS